MDNFPMPEINQIYHMDCFMLMESLPDHSVSLIVTDPPYGISYQNHHTSHRQKILIGDDGIDYKRFAAESYRILKDNSHAYFFTRFDCYPYHYRCLKEAGFTVKNCLVIEKGNRGIGDLHGSYASNSEWAVFCHKGRKVFEKTMLRVNRQEKDKYQTRFNSCWFGDGYPKSTCSRGWQKKHRIFHPTIKAVECLEWLIQISSKTGEIVFDGFMGSGSTAVAAMNTKRQFIGAEIDKQFYEMAVKRIGTEKMLQQGKGVID